VSCEKGFSSDVWPCGAEWVAMWARVWGGPGWMAGRDVASTLPVMAVLSALDGIVDGGWPPSGMRL
jgi:hypothetical protein